MTIHGDIRDAVTALDMALKSGAPIDENVTACREWLYKRGLNGDADIAKVVAKYEVGVESVEKKIERGVDYGQTLQRAIDDYAEKYGVSKSVACDKICIGTSLPSDYHRLDARMAVEAESGRLNKAYDELQKTGHVSHPSEWMSPHDVQTSLNDGPKFRNPQATKPAAIPSKTRARGQESAVATGRDRQDDSVFEDVDDDLEKMIDEEMRKNPSMSRANAVEKASHRFMARQKVALTSTADHTRNSEG